MIDIAGNRTLAETRRGLVPTGVLVAVGGLNKSRWIDRWAFYEERGCPLERWLSYGIELDNAVIDAGQPATFGFHLCRGNQLSRWLVAGGYDAIAAPVFGGVHADRLLLEYDDERSGTFNPLRLVPDDKVVVLGLVTTKTSRIETPKRIKTRLREASSLVDAERLALSPQCGFATSVADNAIAPRRNAPNSPC